MSAARRDQSMHIDLSNNASQELPSIAAAFLIYFDVKAGYTIAWQRSLPGVKLEGVVEYKSLPSGLHKVKEDLIYYVHDQYAGLSAFVNEPAEENERNALMVAVGVLVPLSYGRLGRSWKHAERLKDLSRQLVHDITKTQPLEEFWECHRLPNDTTSSLGESPLDPPSTFRFKPNAVQAPRESKAPGRGRSVSDATTFVPPGQTLSPYHPALSLATFLNALGPLLFPLHRAALLRKRILLMGQAPVELACNYVYDLSILSNIPISVADLLSAEEPPLRLRPLFTVGIHDIPFLEKEAHVGLDGLSNPATPTIDGPADDYVAGSWVACSTDEVLATKAELYDVIVNLPPSYSQDAKEKVWPKIEYSDRTEIRATQRDLRRYRALRRGLRRWQRMDKTRNASNAENISSTDRMSLLPDNAQGAFDDAASTSDEKLVEQSSWPALAYSSFMWWASAGEKRADLQEEDERDASLLADISDSNHNTPLRPRSHSGTNMSPHLAQIAAPEMALIAYFHRLTTLILSTLADLVDLHDEGSSEGNQAESQEETVIFVSSEDMGRMGLDVWSEADKAFVEDVMELYFGRSAEVQGARVECCGIRIC
ncbi:MAG: hypothetical protein M1835_003342 [Candelina submexicana]|nr:MAG: hypothetical protein M1835_003342 [Candelina submexicana]